MTSDNTSSSQRTPVTGDEIDLGQIFGVLLEHKWLIVAVTFVFALGGFLQGHFATPIYRADSLLQIEDKQTTLSGLGDTNELFGEESSAKAQVEILRSRMVLGRVVDQLNMTIEVEPKSSGFLDRFRSEAVPQGLAVPLYAGYRSNDVAVAVNNFRVPPELKGRAFTLVNEDGKATLYLDETRLGQADEQGVIEAEDWRIMLNLKEWQQPADQKLRITRRERLSVINGLKNSLNVSEKGETGILEVSMDGPRRDRIQQTLDTVNDTYVMQNIRREAAEAEKSLEFLEEQLPEIRSDLNKAENRMNEYRLERGSVDLDMETQALLNRIVELDARLNELKVEEAEVARRYTRSHPTYQALIDQRERLEEERDQLTERTHELPETQQQMLRMQRDVRVNQEIYVNLRNKAQELRVLKAGTVGNVRIIDDAKVQPGLVAPRRARTLVVATMLGALLSIGFVLVRAFFNRGLESPAELEERGITVYAAIPLSADERKAEARFRAQQKRHPKGKHTKPLLACENPSDLAIESLRSLRTSLHFAMMEAHNKVVVITGPSPDVGKSFITDNLAAVMAQAGKSVVLVDADMRKGHLHRYLDTNDPRGLSELLSGKLSLDEVLKKDLGPGMDLISRGQRPPNPSELLMHERFEAMLETLNERYDFVLVDTPPVLAVTDCAIVAQKAGTSLMVARYGKNSAKEVEYAIDRLANNNVEIRGAIINFMEQKRSNEYGYYAYGYKYKSDS